MSHVPKQKICFQEVVTHLTQNTHCTSYSLLDAILCLNIVIDTMNACGLKCVDVLQKKYSSLSVIQYDEFMFFSGDHNI